MLYISHRERSTRVLGPGLRYVIWVQGCLKRCPNCINPAGRPLDRNGYHIDTEILFQEIGSTPHLTGITISGGEPFLQADDLVGLIRRIKTETTLDVMIYSGYTLDELRARNSPAVDEILAGTDLLVDGEYVEEKNFNRLYRGSDNQTIHFLSKKYLPFKDRIEAAHNRDVEFICRGEELFVVGIPIKGFQKQFINKIWEAQK